MVISTICGNQREVKIGLGGKISEDLAQQENSHLSLVLFLIITAGGMHME